jgi:hypothetical protein
VDVIDGGARIAELAQERLRVLHHQVDVERHGRRARGSRARRAGRS